MVPNSKQGLSNMGSKYGYIFKLFLTQIILSIGIYKIYTLNGVVFDEFISQIIIISL